MNAKYEKTVEHVFAQPTKANIKWHDIETMLISLGADIEEGRGSRVRFRLRGAVASFHRPHPSPDTKQYAVKEVRNFRIEAGIADQQGKLIEN